jgi:hypothetical protein
MRWDSRTLLDPEITRRVSGFRVDDLRTRSRMFWHWTLGDGARVWTSKSLPVAVAERLGGMGAPFIPSRAVFFVEDYPRQTP